MRLADELAGEFDTMVVLGIGGSALGTKAVLDAVPASIRPRRMAVHVADNVDPTSFGALLGSLDPARTCFNVISKSGGTSWTLSSVCCSNGSSESQRVPSCTITKQ